MSRVEMQLSPRRMATVAALALVFFLSSVVTGCFNTYTLSQDEFTKLQAADEIPLTVASKGGEKLLVDRETPIYVRSLGGRRYPLTPFNFKMTSSQLVASDRDTLLAISDLSDYEVDLFSDTQTILLISAGVAVVAGLIVITAVTAGSKSFSEN